MQTRSYNIMYKLIPNTDGIQFGGLGIPNDPRNTDWQRYQQWLSEGNTPEPAETEAEIATREQEETNASAIAYLAETDWYLLRELDGGVAMTAVMKAERAKRRLEVTR